MPDRNIAPAPPTSPRIVENPRETPNAEPVREYVCDLAGELARMARDVGDNLLAEALEAAANIAMRPMTRPIVLATSLKRRA
jgi:hypothetical protein